MLSWTSVVLKQIAPIRWPFVHLNSVLFGEKRTAPFRATRKESDISFLANMIPSNTTFSYNMVIATKYIIKN